ncbi:MULTISPECIES: phosphatidate cytidylyltransferase [unclassified Pseudomonas]|uniref:phosphatidate cytidylyltransferase n=1 Tax=unclassified Pseudomonas TaxID=196821 RepID=UPI001C5B321D|nr:MULTISPECIES: phosphatidate cytidylyltransferase [unclassified Pseudomonas]MBW3504162.1 phosphatidate cytidylyltransferase [Pseudomonas sp. NKUCC02_KPG]MEC4166667.1 phosphatidate cytidylyltransferase [Pseudomonas sp. MS-1(2024)]
MLKQRIITALILLPIALCGFFLLEGSGFALFIGLVVTLGAWEWARLAGFEAQSARVLFAAVVALLLFGLHIFPDLAPWVLGAAVLWWALATFLVLTFPQSAVHWSSIATKLVIGLLILLPAWQGLVLIKAMPLGNWLIMAVMVLVWGADIGAYFSGRKFGKRKLAPKVSPGKSWEGVFGGLLLSLLITAAVGIVRDWSASQMFAALVGAALIVLISVVGDLTESMFKRQAGVKDSSNLLPGHGGVLDRIDSLTAAIPVFAVLLWMAAS